MKTSMSTLDGDHVSKDSEPANAMGTSERHLQISKSGIEVPGGVAKEGIAFFSFSSIRLTLRPQVHVSVQWTYQGVRRKQDAPFGDVLSRYLSVFIHRKAAYGFLFVASWTGIRLRTKPSVRNNDKDTRSTMENTRLIPCCMYMVTRCSNRPVFTR